MQGLRYGGSAQWARGCSSVTFQRELLTSEMHVHNACYLGRKASDLIIHGPHFLSCSTPIFLTLAGSLHHQRTPSASTPHFSEAMLTSMYSLMNYLHSQLSRYIRYIACCGHTFQQGLKQLCQILNGSQANQEIVKLQRQRVNKTRTPPEGVSVIAAIIT